MCGGGTTRTAHTTNTTTCMLPSRHRRRPRRRTTSRPHQPHRRSLPQCRIPWQLKSHQPHRRSLPQCRIPWQLKSHQPHRHSLPQCRIPWRLKSWRQLRPSGAWRSTPPHLPHAQCQLWTLQALPSLLDPRTVTMRSRRRPRRRTTSRLRPSSRRRTTSRLRPSSRLPSSCLRLCQQIRFTPSCTPMTTSAARTGYSFLFPTSHTSPSCAHLTTSAARTGRQRVGSRTETEGSRVGGEEHWI